ncbi:type III-B CRISPR module RAMP protein Cmr4 [Microbacterium sp.]|uniref:type III-B CRISPR module RAMP protein Cmr4 n=1 Tax=Microbacterium sp. TaxID=51671 RepID=UPI003A83B910
MISYLLYLYAETPVHAGADTSVGVVDNPIQRESTTGFPVVWGQSLKGALRDAARTACPDDVVALFGSEVDTPGDKDRGALLVGDARVVTLPVATLTRTFAWTTSRLVLSRLTRTWQRLGMHTLEVPDVAGDGVGASDRWKGEHALGDLVCDIAHSDTATAWAERIASDALPNNVAGFDTFTKKLAEDLVVMSDHAFGYTIEHATEVLPRIALDNAKAVTGGPFYAEYLPTDTVLASTLTLRPGRTAQETESLEQAVEALFTSQLLQVGGDETLGKGLLWSRLHKAVDEKAGEA